MSHKPDPTKFEGEGQTGCGTGVIVGLPPAGSEIRGSPLGSGQPAASGSNLRTGVKQVVARGVTVRERAARGRKLQQTGIGVVAEGAE